ncbi:transposase [Piscirickettsia salmonis]
MIRHRRLLGSSHHSLFRFKKAAETLLKTAKDKGITIGIFAAIHTFGRDLKWNVHVHISVTRGGLSKDGKNWESIYFANKVIMPIVSVATSVGILHIQ